MNDDEEAIHGLSAQQTSLQRIPVYCLELALLEPFEKDRLALTSAPRTLDPSSTFSLAQTSKLSFSR